MVKLGIYSGLTVAFCCALITSNVFATKTLDLGMFALPASILTFPTMYIINDVLSGVCGFLAMRRTISLDLMLLPLRLSRTIWQLLFPVFSLKWRMHLH